MSLFPRSKPVKPPITCDDERVKLFMAWLSAHENRDLDAMRKAFRALRLLGFVVSLKANQPGAGR
jgi:hypothetical protein